MFERTRRPLPRAAHKVGESTVEIGAHYFGHALGLHDYLLEHHLPKNGLRFFSGPARSAPDARTEMGPRERPRVPAYQIDRGLFENDLRARCLEAGVDLREGWGVRAITVGEPHRVEALPTREGEAAAEFTAPWVIDATGRRRMLLKSLGLERPVERQASSSWFRVRGRVRIEELVDPKAERWHERDVESSRWLSTNHLCGRGYWVWIIPLPDGLTSVGIVAENEAHDFRSYSTEAGTMSWLREHEPALESRLRELERIDFIAMRDFRMDAAQVFSADRWASVGEAGVFVDPLYSPGSDMIGLANSIAADLIVRDLEDGAHDAGHVRAMNAFFFDWVALLSRTLFGSSLTMGSPEVFSAKLYWDYFYYWAFMCPYFFSRGFSVGVEEHAKVRDHARPLRRAQRSRSARVERVGALRIG